MDQEKKFDEFKEKLLRYWAVFLAACGKFWNLVREYTQKAVIWLRVNGKILLQKLAAWLLKAREWWLSATTDLRVKGKDALAALSVRFAELKEKLRPLPGRAKAWCLATAARLKGGKTADESEALPAAEELKALPETVEEPVVEMEEKILPVVEMAVEEPAPEVPAAVEAEEPAVEAEQTWIQKTLAVFAAAGRVIKKILKTLWKLRKVFMAAPVVWAAVKFALLNADRLPEQVGLDIQSTGEFARMITRQQAVFWPLGITMFCLLLMFCAKKPVLPWVISIFTLVLPWLLWILNYYA